jgi:hypothetical protein
LRVQAADGDVVKTDFRQRGGVAFATAGVAAAAGIALITKQAIDAADAARKTAQSVGISVESLTGLQFAAGQSGLEVDQFASAMVKLDKAIGEAANLKLAEAAQAEARVEQVVAAPLVVPSLVRPVAAPASKAAGVGKRSDWVYEVTDIKAAYAAAPHLFSVEIKASAVNATCNASSVIPGIRFWEELSTSFRS